MIEDLHRDEDLPIPAATGWSAMHALLNKEMPEKKLNRRFILFSLLTIAVMLSLFIVVSVKLNRDYYIANFYNSTGNSKAIKEKISPKENTSLLPLGYDNIVTKTKQTIKKRKEQDLFIRSKRNLDKLDTSFETPDQTIARPEKNKIIFTFLPSISKTSIYVPVVNKKTSFKRWNFYAGAAVNTATSTDQNFQPYPIASLRYYLHPHLFISSGLSLFSPAPGNRSGVSKTVHVNDVINNTSYYNEVTHFKKLVYADMPISLGIQIDKQLSIQVGFQSSLLLSKHTSIEKVSYDFLMNRIEDSGLATTYAAPLPTQFFKVKLPTMDYRIISGINYQMKKTAVSLQYQGSLRSAFKPKSSLVTIQLSWQLK